MRIRVCFILITILIIGGCNEDTSSKVPVASAKLVGVTMNPDSSYSSTTSEYGEVMLESLGTSLRMTVTLTNGTPNYSHAIHVHMGSCEQPGHHWNQGLNTSFCESMNNGEIWARPKAGDVGNVNTDSNGNGVLVVESEFWSIGNDDATDLEGAVIIVHENMEDFFSECFDGDHNHIHMNPKIACGSIELN